MASYRFRFLQEDQCLFQVDRDVANDLDALDNAEIMSGDYEVEIWSGNRFVARIKQGAAALTAESDWPLSGP